MIYVSCSALAPTLNHTVAKAFLSLHLCVCLLGPGSNPCSLLMCHSHRQEPLELFCESCDLLCCSSCHLSSHKNHRSVLWCTAQGRCRDGANRRLNTFSQMKLALTDLSLLSCRSAYTTLGWPNFHYAFIPYFVCVMLQCSCCLEGHLHNVLSLRKNTFNCGVAHARKNKLASFLLGE